MGKNIVCATYGRQLGMDDGSWWVMDFVARQGSLAGDKHIITPCKTP